MTPRDIDAGPEIVELGPDDWQEFRDVRLASLLDAPDAFGATYADWADAPEERWRRRLADVPFTVLARTPQGPVGVVSGTAPGPGVEAVELISMWVAPSHRGTGLGAALIARVVARAAALGRPTVLMVREDNAVAIRAYERAGFVDLGVPPDRPAGAPRERRMRHGG